MNTLVQTETPPVSEAQLRAPRGPHVFTISAFGARIGIHLNDETLTEWLGGCVPDRMTFDSSRDVDASISVTASSRNPARKEQFAFVCGDGYNAAGSQNLEELAADFESQLRFLIAKFARDAAFVHAGVVGWKGRALVIPGSSRSGKSSLVAALIKSGADYISDEHAILDGEGRVLPWCKPISIRGAAQSRQKQVPHSAFGARFVTEPVPVAIVLETRYRPRARWRPAPLTASEIALAMMGHAVAAQLRPEPVMHALTIAAKRARGFRTDRPDVGRAVPHIFAMLESELESGPDRPGPANGWNAPCR